jgi:hypothetical protein
MPTAHSRKPPSSWTSSATWIGADTHNLATDKQRKKHNAQLKQVGLPAWIDSIDGKKLTITFFAGIRSDFTALLGADPYGKDVFTTLADEDLRPAGRDDAIPGAPVETMSFRGHLPEGLTAGAYGCSGVRWVIEPKVLPDGYKPGRIIRVLKEDWTPGK